MRAADRRLSPVTLPTADEDRMVEVAHPSWPDGTRTRFRLRIWNTPRPVALATELGVNEGMSVTNNIENVAAYVTAIYGAEAVLVEHYNRDSFAGGRQGLPETFDLVAVRPGAEPHWQHLEPADFQAMIRKVAEQVCPRCMGSGSWPIPENSPGRRWDEVGPCRLCDGTGLAKRAPHV